MSEAHHEAGRDRLAARFRSALGGDAVLIDADDVAPYLVEPRGLFHGDTPFVLRPRTVEDVAEAVRIANDTRTPIVPQGGNTGLVGGGVPDASGRQVVLSLARLDRIREVDAEGFTMTVEAGVILETVQRAAREAGRLFPLTLSAEGSCRIGGNIATNAGGTGVLAYGNTRDLVLGLEVVLPTGEIWNGLRRLHKDNTGYDLKHLFIGSEGTLGIVTAAVLKLFPRPVSQAVAMAGVADLEAALELLAALKRAAGNGLTAFELMSDRAVAFSVKHGHEVRDPFAGDATPPWYLLIEISSGREPEAARAEIEAVLARCYEAGTISHAVIAESLDQANALWKVRHAVSDTQNLEGGSIKHDVSVPVARVPEFVRRAVAAAVAVVPDCRPVPFGHLGDGNVHFNVTQPVGADKAGFLARYADMNAAVHAIVIELGGSISAEHGIGSLKRHLLPQVKPAIEIELMRRIKAAFDPNAIVNPGKVL